MSLKMKQLKDLTLKEKIGQLIVVGFGTKEYDNQINHMVDNYSCGNAILFARNYSDPKQMKKLCKDIHENIYKKTGVVPFIAIDQEGGMVTRMMSGVTFAPSQMSCSASSVNDAAYLSGKMLSRDMIRLGLNLDLAPCLEVNPNLSNPMVNIRSYSSNPVTAGNMAKRFMKGLSEYGVLGCTKHFPGCGEADADDHLEITTINQSKEEIEKIGLVPFKMNIDTPSIMTCHSIFKDLDDVPSTLSKTVLQGLLRKEMGYKGLIISDCVEMKAIANFCGSANGAVRALVAGCDLILVCETWETQDEVFNALYKAVEDGVLKEELIDEKVERILSYKEKTLPYLEKYFFENNEEYVPSNENNELAQEIVDKSITVVKGKEPKLGKNTLVVAPIPTIASLVEESFEIRSLTNALKAKFPNNDIYEFVRTSEFKDFLLKEIEKHDDMIFFSYDASMDATQVEAINALLETNKDIYVVSLKGPMDQSLFKNLKNYMCLYEYTPNSIRAIVKYLNNEIKVEGKLPYGD